MHTSLIYYLSGLVYSTGMLIIFFFFFQPFPLFQKIELCKAKELQARYVGKQVSVS